MLEASIIDVDQLTTHGIPLGPHSVCNVAVSTGANVYPIVLSANCSGCLVAVSECFPNAAWKSTGSVIVPGSSNQRAVLSNVSKSELQGVGSAGNTFAFTADLQPFNGMNTNSPVTDSTPFSVQLAVANCAQACNVYVTLA